ncbi:flavin reductase family protein [Kroppenstedtia sanguinis]|uniref:Flavin reductase family protein n=1 Tax=Kroppenstedtia sanguinis TaxID=1380684 RepID=A0ABW4C5W4_9BACL
MDDRHFRNAMGRFATGVTVITTQVEDEVHGMTANAFMSVSLNPKLITVSVDHQAHMHKKLKKSKGFAVSILSKEQRDISMHFAGQKLMDEEINFDFVAGVPVIPDALATVVCNAHSSHDLGDHTLYVGEVIEIGLHEGDPLTFFAGRYGSLTEQ